MRDGDLRPLIHRYLRSGVFWVPVETWGVSSGVPDSWYLARGGASGWVESKGGRRPRMRPEQISWLLRCARYGGRCFVAVRSPSGDRLDLYRGGDADKIFRGAEPAGAWVGGPSRWDWDEVRYHLTS